MQTVGELFDSFDGPANVGRAIGKTTEHAFAMKRRRSVPVRYWPALLRAAREREIAITEAMLIQMHTCSHPGTTT